MCGIAGFQKGPDDKELNLKTRKRLAQALLGGIESRGRDAAGAAWRDRAGDVWIQKDPIPAADLADGLDTNGDMTTCILHARWATHGSPDFAHNNHPIQVDSIVGVHNGVCRNHKEIFDLLGLHGVKRVGTVDTEAIFALIRYGARPFPEVARRAELLSLVEGTAALAWIRVKDDKDTLYLARAYGSPLVIAQTKGGSLVFASTEQILRAACRKADVSVAKMYTVKEGHAYRARGGRLKDVLDFPYENGGKIYRTPNYRNASTWEMMSA